MKICFVPADPDGPGSYRCLFPMAELARNGHVAKLPPHEFDPERKLGMLRFHLDEAMGADVYVLHLPQMREYLEFALRARLHGAVVVGETDDDFVNLTPDHPAYYGTDEHPAFNRHWMKRVFQACDALTVTTSHLRAVYSEVHRNVHVLPNYLNWDMWRDIMPRYMTRPERVSVGWMGSAHWRPRDMRILVDVMVPFLDKHPEVDLVLVGDTRPDEAKTHRHTALDGRKILAELPPERVTHIPGEPLRKRPDMTDLSALPRITNTFDIGLVPLALTPFNESKSCLKGMEYGACGIPCVASPTEPYRGWVQEGVNGFLAETPAEWEQALEALLDDERRRRMGEAARKKASKHTIQRHWREWAELYQSLYLNREPYMPGSFSEKVFA